MWLTVDPEINLPFPTSLPYGRLARGDCGHSVRTKELMVTVRWESDGFDAAGMSCPFKFSFSQTGVPASLVSAIAALRFALGVWKRPLTDRVQAELHVPYCQPFRLSV